MLTHPSANLTHARHAADKLIKRFTITRPEDIALEDMAMALGVLVVEDHLEGAEARLLRSGARAPDVAPAQQATDAHDQWLSQGVDLAGKTALALLGL
jgi:hypothetical protein